MTSIGDLDTPVPLVDIGRLESNLGDMAKRVAAGSARLRPHAKTHKTAEIARLQLGHGAIGLTVAKVGEAEAFVAAGIEDLLIAYPVVGAPKYGRLLALLDRASVRFTVDSVAGAAAASEFFGATGREVDVLIEIDSGIGRTGVQSVEEAVQLADRVDELPGLRVAGVLGYAGGYVAGAENRAELGRREGEQAAACARAIAAAGHDAAVVSVGSTPTAPSAAAVADVSEVRPGNYAFYDLKQVEIGTASFDDCALTILATVISHPVPSRYVVDAGIKTLAGEDYGWGTYGRILDRPDIVITWATEEHGIITLGDDVADPGWHVGDFVRIIPDHACGAVNMHDELIAVDGEAIVDRWPVIARGRVR